MCMRSAGAFLRTVLFMGIIALGHLPVAYSEEAERAPAIVRSDDHAEIPVSVLRTIKLPKGYHEGLFIDGQTMWVANGKRGQIWVVDIASGKVLKSIVPVGTFTEGITTLVAGEYLVTDWEDKKLYRAKLKADVLVPDAGVSFAPSFPAGVVWNGENLFVITWTRGVLGTRYHLLRLDSIGTVLERMAIQAIEEPSQMAWDGTYLWMTSWYSKRVYAIDIAKKEIVGSFVSPVPGATGLAWDGKTLWITGTHADLYQLEVGPVRRR